MLLLYPGIDLSLDEGVFVRDEERNQRMTGASSAAERLAQGGGLHASASRTRGAVRRATLHVVSTLALAILLLLASWALGLAAASAASKGVAGFFPSSLETGSLGGQLNGPFGVAVNSTGAGDADPGDVYVADGSNQRVQVFSAEGVFKFAFGRDVIRPGAPGSAAINEVQQIAVAGATGGTFTVEMSGPLGGSGAIPFNASAGVVEAAIEQSASVGAGNVSVSGPAGGPWDVEFVGGLADRDVAQLTGLAGPAVNSNTGVAYGLTPSPGASVSVSTITPGANAFERCSVVGDCKAGLSGVLGGMFSGPRGVAVDQSDGSVYVSEQSNLRVQKFSADGSFVRAWGKDVSVGDVSGADEVCTVASDCKAGVTGGTTVARGGEFSSTFSGYLAVAPPGAPNAGNVVVADPGNRRVQEFGPAGGFVRAWGFDVVQTGAVTGFEVCTVKTECKTAAAGGSGVGQFAASQPTRVAVDSTGATYTVENTGNFRVQKFDSGLTTPAVFAAATLSGSAAANGPTDVAIGQGDNVLVAKQFASGTGTPPVATVGERRVLELDSTGTLLDTHAVLAGIGFVSPGGTVSGVDGIAVDAGSGAILVASSRYAVPGSPNAIVASRVYALGSVASASGIVGVSAVAAHSALLSGAVNANGPEMPFGVRTSYRLEASEDGVTWSALAEADIGNSETPVGFSKTMSGLSANTSYQSRIVLTKQFQPQVVVPGPTFVTAASRPDVEALSPTEKSATSVTLNARINPNGSPTSYRLEYGPTVAYGNTIPIPDGNAGSGSAATVVPQPITGLEPDTTYHFRVVATNANGTAVSADRAFKTRAQVQPPDGRVYELVSPADKVGGVGVGFWGTTAARLGGSGVAALTGERFAVGGNYGAPLDGESKHGFTNDWSFAQRDSDQLGWRSHSPITHSNYQPQIAQYVAIGSTSEDLSRVYVNGGNVTPTIFPEMGADAMWTKFNAGFFVDWGSPVSPSRWELLGPASLDQVGSLGPRASSPWSVAFSADGSALIGETVFDDAVGAPKRSMFFGLAGDGDPTRPEFGDLVSGRSVYRAETAGVPADSYLGTGDRELVNACDGQEADRTQLPSVEGGLIVARICDEPEDGRDWRLISKHGAALSASAASALGGMVSADASRVFFMSPDPLAEQTPDATGNPCSGVEEETVCPAQLYVRQANPDGTTTTRWISRAEPSLFGTQATSLTAAIRFEGATPDGRRVFFRTTSPLTADDPNGLGAPPPGGVKTGVANPASSDLYMYEFPTDPHADIDDGTLTRISAGPDGDGDCNSPLPVDNTNANSAALRFASDDGKRVYFVCTAPLAGVGDATNGSITTPGGTTSTSDQTNLYLYDEHQPASRRWRFIARIPRAVAGGNPLVSCASSGASRRSPLTAEAGIVGEQILVAADGQANCVNGTSDGSFVTLFTMGRLTGDDPTNLATGDVYAYDAATDELDRVTANQGGAGGTYLCAPGKDGTPQPTDTALCHGDNGIGNTTNVITIQGGVVNSDLGLVADPGDPGDRIAFFSSAARLVAADEDSGYDVYQWRNGKLSLITPGTADSQHAMYKGNTRDGRNVYFATMDSLTWQDHDAVADVYTARVGGGIEEPVDPVICDVLGGVCQDGSDAGSITTAPSTAAVGAGDDATVRRRVLSIAAVGSRARSRAARSGTLVLSVRTNATGAVRVVGRARLAGRLVKVADTRAAVTGSGVVKVRVRLNARARRALRAGRRLRVGLRVTQPGIRARTATVELKRGKRS